MSRQRMVTVCDQCFRACCWHGIFMCDESQTAGTVDKPTSELKRLKVEHPSFYSVKSIREHTGQEPRFQES